MDRLVDGTGRGRDGQARKEQTPSGAPQHVNPSSGAEPGPPPLLGVRLDPLRDGPSSVAVALAAAVEEHEGTSASRSAAVAGAALADAATPADRFTNPSQVADAFVEVHAALGTKPRVLAVEDDRLEVVLAGCPFAAPVPPVESLRQVSIALLGRLASRLHGAATVVPSEEGDECRLTVWLGPRPAGVSGQSYHWPPQSRPSEHEAPHLEISLALPRESASVPVVRRLAAQALRAFGITADDVYDVELAISEACANVIDHAADTETYEVEIRLAADRCVITVVDQGGGFDSGSVPAEAAEHAETGRGLALMRQLVDKLAFDDQPQAGAVVHMVKALHYDVSHPLRHSILLVEPSER